MFFVFFLLTIFFVNCNGHKRIYVMGAESSGTRYMASGVSKLLDNDSVWTGYIPGCHYISRDISIQHVSLPSNGKCDGNIHIIPHVDKCAKIPTEYRWFANITNILDTDHDAVAIFIVRDGYFTKRSITKNHCSKGIKVTTKEYDTANKLITQALTTFPKRTLLISYELLANFPWHQWRLVEDFLEIPKHDAGYYKLFKNGNI